MVTLNDNSSSNSPSKSNRAFALAVNLSFFPADSVTKIETYVDYQC